MAAAHREQLPADLRERLDAVKLSMIIRYVGEALGLADGQRKLEVQFGDAGIRRGDLHIGPLRADELDELDQRRSGG